ncbi:carboxy-S-adenosyl-L-methionine synthase CmoA [Shewanella sp. OPT22]|nr:carboxy-S-adenosyl-L-methionine synthase CmoA [Shewanella sp. OPT22]
MTHSQDKIYARPHSTIDKFKFDNNVAGVFDDMIRRSIPNYEQIIASIGDIAAQTVQKNTNVYDLGCSLGSATISMRRKISTDNVKIIAVDNSESMIRRCSEHISAYRSDIPVELVCADINNINIENASVVVLNFTLQFLEPAARKQLITKIYNGLVGGGVLILSEKLQFSKPKIQHLLDELHLDFKRANGYSELEISQKRSALEDVMRTETAESHISRLNECGFQQASVWFQCFNFASMVAIK